jgi:glycosyltransferase involved in cell wall biosynthesis
MSVCVLIPAFNEAATIAQVVSGVRARLPDAFIIVVDDGSSDETFERAKTAGADVLRHEQNRGKGHAVRSGLAHVLALAPPCSHVLMMDGDLQHRPEDALKLLDAARATGADVVVGARVFDKAQMPASRYYANVIGSWALSSFIGSSIKDSQSGFRLIRCDVLRGMKLESTGYEIETEMLIKLSRRGARMVSVPVTLHYGGKSKLRPIRDTTRTCFLAVYYRFLRRE